MGFKAILIMDNELAAGPRKVCKKEVFLVVSAIKKLLSFYDYKHTYMYICVCLYIY